MKKLWKNWKKKGYRIVETAERKLSLTTDRDLKDGNLKLADPSAWQIDEDKSYYIEAWDWFGWSRIDCSESFASEAEAQKKIQQLIDFERQVIKMGKTLGVHKRPIHTVWYYNEGENEQERREAEA